MMLSGNKIQRDLVIPPTVSFTPRALQELNLIIENDLTLKGKYFRVLISGKGCDGFTYSAGFTDIDPDDFVVPIKNCTNETHIIIDPFAAFYLGETTVDYVQDLLNGQEGFTISNDSHNEYKGKFWRKDQTKVPPTKRL